VSNREVDHPVEAAKETCERTKSANQPLCDFREILVKTALK